MTNCPNCAAAEGERDALRERLDTAICVHCGMVGPPIETHWRECPTHPAHAALAEARGREKVLREALEELLADIDNSGSYVSDEAVEQARAALALPSSPQGRPEKDLKAVAPGLKSEEGK